jgi:TrmH family RNA methyltransferase
MFVTPGTADPFGPTAVRASMGSISAVSLVRANWNEVVHSCRCSGSRLIGTSPHGRTSYRAADLSGSIVVAVGSEGPGLGPRELDRCDDVLRIPMAGRLDSLNLAVAAGIVLFEASHQRHPAEDLGATTHPGA